MNKQYTIEYAKELEQADKLNRFRDEFYIQDQSLVYLNGNSLGRAPKKALESLDFYAKHQWGVRLVRAWGEGLMDLTKKIGAKIAKLIGAEPNEVIIADSTSVNLFKLVVAALLAKPERKVIVTDEFNFPSDLYILQGAIKLLGNKHEIKIIKSTDGITISQASIEEALNSDTALVALTATSFKSGFNYDLEAVTNLAHKHGAYMLFDLCHTVGALPIDLKGSKVDLAIGCTYKYLNGGPGSPAFLYVRKDLQEKLLNPISGWFGHNDQFNFELDYHPAGNIKKFLTGTPPVLSIIGIEAGVDLILEAGIENLRAKSVSQSQYFIELYDHFLKPLGVTLNSPRDPKLRGSHVSLGHPEGYRIDQTLIKDMNVIPDFRSPDNIRFGITPIYTTYEEIFKAITAFKNILENKIYEKYSQAREVVT